MNTDFRVSIGLVSHPKALKMMRRCGDRSFYCLVHLWGWAAQYRPDGNLSGMDDEAIEIASDWQGDIGMFAKHLEEVGFLDGKEGSYSLHDWRKCHNHIKAENLSKRPNSKVWKKIKNVVFKRDNYRCVYCGIFPEKIECDHILPISRGGNNTIENLATSCPTCNRKKGKKTIDEWVIA